MYQLRDYQSNGLEKLRIQMRAGRRRLLLVSPVGSGKTTIAAAMISGAAERGNRVLFLVHRNELLVQAVERLAEQGLTAGVIKAGRHGDLTQLIQVASIQTLVRRQPVPAELIIVDEAHHTAAKIYRRVLERYPDAWVIGLTATPVRLDGKGLGDYYDCLVEVAKSSELLAGGWLVAPTLFCPPAPDLRGIRKVAGDWTGQSLVQVMGGREIVGRVAEHWKQHARGKRSVLFACTIEHSSLMKKTLQDAGARVAHLDCHTDSSERAAILADLRDGALDVVTNVGILTEGWDLPSLECVILTRPTASEAMLTQMIGRVMRPSPGKTSALVLDHAGNILRLGSPLIDRDWALTDGVAKHDRLVNNPRQCPSCWVVLPVDMDECPECGEILPRPVRSIPVEVKTDLVEITSVQAAAKPGAWQIYLGLYQRAARCGFKAGWAAHRFRVMFGAWPPWSWREKAKHEVMLARK